MNKKMNKRIELFPNETIVLKERIHWKNYIFPGTILLCGLIMGLLRVTDMGTTFIEMLAGAPPLGDDATKIIATIELIAAICIRLMSLLRIIIISTVRYYVTSKRIISTWGFVTKSINEMLLARCETVLMHQSVSERLFQCGDIECIAPGSVIHLEDVYYPVRFKMTVMSEMARIKDGNAGQN